VVIQDQSECEALTAGFGELTQPGEVSQGVIELEGLGRLTWKEMVALVDVMVGMVWTDRTLAERDQLFYLSRADPQKKLGELQPFQPLAHLMHCLRSRRLATRWRRIEPSRGRARRGIVDADYCLLAGMMRSFLVGGMKECASVYRL
jgi:hypothetical protein